MASLRFFKTFLTSPKQIGAILPSGVALSKQITAPIDFENAKVIVEFGPGTGSFTRVLLERKKKDTRLIAFEINDEMADFVAKEFPGVELVRGSAEKLVGYLKEQKIAEIDAVVSGLPFANFPVPVQTAILEGVASSLKPGGFFLGFTYFHSSVVPATHRYRAKLKKIFKSVDRIAVMKNVPPAYVMRCQKSSERSESGSQSSERSESGSQ